MYVVCKVPCYYGNKTHKLRELLAGNRDNLSNTETIDEEMID